MPSASFSAKPHITADDELLMFVGPTTADREAFEAERDLFNAGRDLRLDASASRRHDEINREFFICMLGIITIPLCLIALPGAHIIGATVGGPIAAAREPYMPPVPSDRELSQVHEKIKRRLLAAEVAKRLAPDARASQYPRLYIRTESATFTADRMIAIKVLAQGESADGVTWPPTAHVYHLGYAGEGDLDRRLSQAAQTLAESISGAYRLGLVVDNGKLICTPTTPSGGSSCVPKK